MAETNLRKPRWEQLLAVSRQTRKLICGAAVAALFWEIAGRVAQMHPDLLPTPSRILLETWQKASILWINGQSTLVATMIGAGLAAAAAYPISFLISMSPRAHRFLAPVLKLAHRTPLLALAPLPLIWFGFGALPKTLFVFLLAFFPLTDGILRSWRSIPEELTDLFRTMGSGSLQFTIKVRIPGSLPGFFEGMKTAIVMGLSAAIVMEFVAADRGLGYLILSGIAKMEIPLVFAALAVLLTMSCALFAVVILLERVLTPWHTEITPPGRRWLP